MAGSNYSRHSHAAHCAFTGEPLHDVERWEVPSLWTDARPSDVPADAERHHGFVKGGVQFVVWMRTAPVTNATCSHCADQRAA